MLLWSLVNVASASDTLIPYETTVVDRLTSFVGLLVMVGIAFALSEKRTAINWRPVVIGVALQLLLGMVVLMPAVSNIFYTGVNSSVNQLLEFSQAGADFVFGSIAPHKVTVMQPDGSFAEKAQAGVSAPVKTFAFWILPTIVFFSSLMSVLYHLGVMQFIIRGIAWVMVRTLGTSGAESLSAAGNIFVGQTEAPLLIKPFINTMTRSELMAVMVGGFATVAGGVMGAYVGFLEAGIPDIAGHLVMASVMSAPAALAIAKVLVPETEESDTAGEVKITFERTATNVMEAAGNGATDGMKLAINVAAMLIAIVGLVAMLDWFFGFVPVTSCADGYVGGYGCGVDAQGAAIAGTPFSLSILMGFVFAPIALVMGVPWQDVFEVGQLLGEKVVLTEFLAYIHLGDMVNAPDVNGDGVPDPVLTERGAVIASYALCGFANFASIGIQLGGIGGIAPDRMSDLAQLGFKAMVGGVLAACMTGCVVGIMM